MRLTDAQRRLLDGESGPMIQRLMRLLVRLGEIYGADCMVAIASAQVSGVSHKSIGQPGLAFLEDLADSGVEVNALTFLNPAGMDLQCWRELGFPEDFARQQERIISAYTRMGVVPSATCTPYLAGNLPRFGQHLAWAESSAVSFANSVIGARTNREGGPSALAAAVCGCTAHYGMHLSENRQPQVVVEVTADLTSRADFGALGHFVGEQVQQTIPFFRGLREARTEDLKALGAAMAASGAVALYHAEELTPEAHLMRTKGLASFAVGPRELNQVYDKLNTARRPDLVVLGCPHASLQEIREVASMLQGMQLRIPLWVCTSRTTEKSARATGFAEVIEAAGGRLVADTCMVVSPIERMGFQTVGVDSAKAANYLPGFCGKTVVFRSSEELIEASVRPGPSGGPDSSAASSTDAEGGKGAGG